MSVQIDSVQQNLHSSQLALSRLTNLKDCQANIKIEILMTFTIYLSTKKPKESKILIFDIYVSDED